MNRLSVWFRSAESSSSGEPKMSLEDLMRQEMADIEAAFKATELIMDDDMDGAEALLQKTADSCYHALSLAVISFMRAILGFEKEIMTSASAQLNTCETRAYADQKRAEKEFTVEMCGFYPPGTEYQLVLAEAQLMGAVVGVLHESITEALRSFYKLRKAYFTLEALMKIETSALNAEKNGSLGPGQDSQFNNPRDVFIHSGTNMCFGILLFMFSMIPPSFSRLLSMIGLKGDRERGIRLLWESTEYSNVHGAVAALVLLNYYHGLLGFSDILPTPEHWNDSADAIGYPRAKCEALLVQIQKRYPSSGLWRLEESRLCSTSRNLEGAIAALRRSDAPAPKMKQVSALINFELGLNALFIQDWPLAVEVFSQGLDLNDWSHAAYYFFMGSAEVELYRDALAAGDTEKAKEKKKAASEFLAKVSETSGRKKFMAKQLPFEQYTARKIAKWEERAKTFDIDLIDAIGTSPASEVILLSNGHRRMNAAEAKKALDLLSWDRLTAPAKAVESIKQVLDESASKLVCEAALLRTLGRVSEACQILERDVLCHDKSAFKGPSRDDWILPTAHYEAAVCYWNEACPQAADMSETALSASPSSPASRSTSASPPAQDAPSTAASSNTDISGTNSPGASIATPKTNSMSQNNLNSNSSCREKAKLCQSHLDKVANWEAFVLDARIGLRVQTGLETMKWFQAKMGWA
ncbi:Mitochondrial outer membrane protein iml2 [Ceratocystis lukuohia]|uniref:Inclusion body clearance protein IML2 n=1 Tax=Ceratocystis lukuohia TaxID=2019550 RepID=A0ABR4MHC2_9PEZI